MMNCPRVEQQLTCAKFVEVMTWSLCESLLYILSRPHQPTAFPKRFTMPTIVSCNDFQTCESYHKLFQLIKVNDTLFKLA